MRTGDESIPRVVGAWMKCTLLVGFAVMVSDPPVWTTSVTGAWAKVTIDGRGRDLSRVRPGIRGRSDGRPWPSLSAQRGCTGAIGS
ncbi:hypothetical protein MICRO11B_130019 [Micrococcus luteus]|nr:hypothetical protein MICRO11B_130019 [Micrococcus luteus]